MSTPIRPIRAFLSAAIALAALSAVPASAQSAAEQAWFDRVSGARDASGADTPISYQQPTSRFLAARNGDGFSSSRSAAGAAEARLAGGRL